MMSAKSNLWVMTSRRLSGYLDHAEIARQAIAGGAGAIVMREENFGDEEFVEEALKVKKVCDEREVPLLICDHPEAAFVVNASGLVLDKSRSTAARARKLLTQKELFCIVVKDPLEARQAVLSGADFVVAEPSHVHEIKETMNVPVIAAGGITPSNIRSVLDSEADRIMVCRSAMVRHGIENAVKTLKSHMEGTSHVR